MTIRQTGAKGDFVDTLLQVVALDDEVGPILENSFVLLLGSVYGFLLKLMQRM